MRRALTSRFTALAICLSLATVVPATAASAAPGLRGADLSGFWSVIEEGLDWVWGSWGDQATRPPEQAALAGGTCSDPNGNPLPPGTVCPTPPSNIATDPVVPFEKW